MADLLVDARRFEDDFDRLARIGGTGDGGVHRPALSPAHLEARGWFRERIAADGLEFRRDGAGNHVARLACPAADARTLMLGSHLDSVPRGGRFDGALGVLAAYEVLRVVRDAGLRLPVHLEAIDFTDEEGTLIELMGSRALVGALHPDELERPRGDARLLEEGLRRAGLTRDGVLGARRDPATLAGFLELHIEQGPRLAAAGTSIGIVESIVGIGSFSLRLAGRADHSGTTPMTDRLDAGLGAAELIAAAHETVARRFPQCVINVGRMSLEPGAYNIVPATAELTLEFRAAERERLEDLESALLDLCRRIAQRRGLGLSARPQVAIPPVPCAAEVQQAFAAASSELGLSHVRLASGAGHDTGSLATVCPAGMIFVPSAGGSHSAREHADWSACIDGANTLLRAALLVARR